MRFPVAAKMTFEAPVQTAAALPWRLFLATDCRIGFVTLPNSAANEYSPRACACRHTLHDGDRCRPK
jgi:hypothetical protein